MKEKLLCLQLLVLTVAEAAILMRGSLDIDTGLVFEGLDGPMYNSTELYESQGKLLNLGALPSAFRPGSATNTHSCSQIRGVPSALRSPSHMHPQGLTQYYQKYTEAYGIPIVSSRNPPDDALRRACYVVRFMLADRYDVRDMLYKRHGRVGVIGVNELTNGIPEHSYLPAWWNTRARGLGATDHWPICTNSEENILCHGYPRDKWSTADILVHEFAHGVHMLGAKYAIRGFDARLQQVYNTRKSENRRWANTYAMTNRIEMFAEASESYFDVNAHASPANGIHNEVSTRARLRSYDPELYELVREVFPCGNSIVDRCQKSRSQEENANFKMNCEGGEGGDDKDNDDKDNDDEDCVDVHENCGYWHGEGHCTSGEWVDYMTENCAASCDKCKEEEEEESDDSDPEPCRDTEEHCGYWQGEGYCTGEWADYMMENCPLTCDHCREDVDPEPKPDPDPEPQPTPTCKDKAKSMCLKWKKQNKVDCSKKKYQNKCKKSCEICE